MSAADRGRRLRLGRIATVSVVGADELPAGCLVVSDHPGALDADVLRGYWPTSLAGLRGGAPTVAALRLGQSVLRFAEGGVSPDGSLGRFEPGPFADALAAWRRGWRGAVVPVALHGTYGLTLPSVLTEPAERTRIVVRAGAPVRGFDGTAAELAELVRDRVAGLRAEQADTWFGAQTGDTRLIERAPSWRTAWANAERTDEPGARVRRRIWR